MGAGAAGFGVATIGETYRMGTAASAWNFA